MNEPILKGHKGDGELLIEPVLCSTSEFSAILKDPSRSVMSVFEKQVGKLSYVVGDATRPVGVGPKFLIHCCNDVGLWGAGFVLAVSSRWSLPEEAYYSLGDYGYELGSSQAVKVEDDLWVVNMVGQHGVGVRNGVAPICYDAIRKCLKEVAGLALDSVFRGDFRACSIHAPRFGAGLAGGDWSVIEALIVEELVEKGLSVTIYDFKG